MKIKVLNIIQHPPAYKNYINNSRPEINWDTSDGNWVGIWGYDWPNLLGNEILKLTNEFSYEVLQPDLRADRIYSHKFENGLIHKLFPAKEIKKFYGLKSEKHIYSSSLINYVNSLPRKVIHLNHINDYLTYAVLKNCKSNYLVQVHGKAQHPYFDRKNIRKNILKNFYLNRVNNVLKKRKCYYLYQNSVISKELQRIKCIGYKRLSMGVDFGFYSKKDKIISKNFFKLNSNIITFLIASRFDENKQIDKIITILKTLADRYNFAVLIAGSGEKEYDKYLKSLAQTLISNKKIIFTGYLRDKELLLAHSAADLFISCSVSEGFSVSIMKAIACETPIFSTKVGGIDEILLEQDAGILVDPFDYKQWENEIVDFLNGKPIKIVNRKIAKNLFDWPNIANEFIKIYYKINSLK